MKCILCGSLEQVDDRGPYPVCASCHLEQLECSERVKSGNMLDRDCGELCMRCGLCCVVLSAEAKRDEVEHLANWSGKLPSEIAMVEKQPYPNSGLLVLKRPCVFLLGKPTEYVRCQAYGTRRPKVCEEYLCKIAIRYKAGLCTTNEALFILRSSITRNGTISSFNWCSDGSGKDRKDHKIADLLSTKRALEAIEADGNKIDQVQLMLFRKLHPRYDFDSDLQETIFAAIMTNYESMALDLDQFFAPEKMEGWSDRDKEIALQTIYQVVGDFRGFFRIIS